MDVFLGLLLAVNNFSLDFDETLKLSQRSKKAFQGQSVCSLNESIDLFNVIFFLGGFVTAVFLFFCFHSYIYISIAFRFLPFTFIIRSLICLFALSSLFVSVFLALLVSLSAFSLRLGCIDV